MENKKYIIELSHPIREMLASIILDLDDFGIDEESKKKILVNRKSENKQTGSIWSGNSSRLLFFLLDKIQKKLGLVNFKFYFAKKKSDLVFAHGGFLITDKPYVTYLEKATQIYGYTGKNYGKFLSKLMLRYFLKDKKLKKIFFLTQAAFEGMLNVPEFDRKMKEIIRTKSVVMYPPLENLGNPNPERFKDTKGDMKFLYISNSFYGKGGKELLNAFLKLYQENRAIRLIIISNTKTIGKDDFETIKKNEKIEMYDYVFSPKELFDKFFNQCHVFCYATYSDSFSAVVNEAIAASLPIITSDFYSIPERVIEGYNGFLFKSPFRNYDNNFVIEKEHFTDIYDFYEIISKNQINGKLDYVTDFLFEKMKFFTENRTELQRMSLNCNSIYDEMLNVGKIRYNVNIIMLKAIG